MLFQIKTESNPKNKIFFHETPAMPAAIATPERMPARKRPKIITEAPQRSNQFSNRRNCSCESQLPSFLINKERPLERPSQKRIKSPAQLPSVVETKTKGQFKRPEEARYPPAKITASPG